MLYESVKTVNAGIAFVVRLSSEVDVNVRREENLRKKNLKRNKGQENFTIQKWKTERKNL